MKIFPCGAFLLNSYMKCLSKCLYSNKPFLPCASITLVLTFHPNFHSNIWVFTNLPIYRKLIHDIISLVFWRPRICCLVLFWRRYKFVCILNLICVILKNIYIIFIINTGIILFVSDVLKKIKVIFIRNYLRCCKIPKDIFPIIPILMIGQYCWNYINSALYQISLE